MLLCIREAFEQPSNGFLFCNEVEVDETYIDSESKNRVFKKKSLSNKEVVFSMVERGGKAKIHHVQNSGARVFLKEIDQHIESKAQIYSDLWGSYKSLSKKGYLHDKVNHLE